VLEPEWVTAVERNPSPYFLAVEAVLMYLAEADVHRALKLIAGTFADARIAFDAGRQPRPRHLPAQFVRPRLWVVTEPIFADV
jgi:O-methyltransferase involved in polyketide biosynthesis